MSQKRRAGNEAGAAEVEAAVRRGAQRRCWPAVAGALLAWGATSAAAAPAPAAATSGAAPNAPRADVDLESDGGGRLRYRAEGFTAIIHPDGSVEFRHRVQAPTLSIMGVDPIRGRVQRAPVDRRESSWAAFSERAIYPMGQLPILAGVGGPISGLAEWTRSQRYVPEKQAFLAATAGLRARMRYVWTRAQLERGLGALGEQVVAIWRDPKLSLAERRRRLFTLWDECAEGTGTTPLEALQRAAGRAARAKIVGYVRRVAPLGSAEAYSEAELAALNAGRRSQGRFAPYEGESERVELPEAPTEAPADSGAAEAADATAPSGQEGPEAGPRWTPPE